MEKLQLKKRGLHIEYHAYINMLHRCYNMAHLQYKDYGGRGIKVSDNWIKSFNEFVKDMGRRPIGDGTRTNEYSLDRIDNNKDYSKENCRWATRQVQQINRSETNRNKNPLIYLTINGITKKPSQWAKAAGISSCTLIQRYRRGVTGDFLFQKEKLHPKCKKILNLPGKNTHLSAPINTSYGISDKA